MVVKECKYVIDENDTAKFEFVLTYLLIIIYKCNTLRK